MLRRSDLVSHPDIPGKRYFTIGEVVDLCDVKAHILRYWEQEFEQLTPQKRRGNRRYYRREDIERVREIKHLLYDQGYTIHGARQVLSPSSSDDATSYEKTSNGNKSGSSLEVSLNPLESQPSKQAKMVAYMLNELESVRDLLD